MSWYQDKTNFHPHRPQSICAKKILLPFIINNLNSPDDEEKIINALQKLNGVSKVTTDLPTKKVLVSFNYAKIQVETIIYGVPSA